MADTTTTNQGFTKPEVGASEDTWGTKLNSNWDALDTLVGAVSATEIAILDGATVTTAELNILDGVTATSAELNYLDITTLGTSEASKAVTADSSNVVVISGTLSLHEAIEGVQTFTSTTGAIDFDALSGAVHLYTANQTANRAVNFRGDGSTTLNSMMSIGQSMTFVLALTQGSTAYYLNDYQVDGTAVTPKWQGGSAPSGGNDSSVDVYTFTVIKTADATYIVLAAQTQYA